MGLWTKFTEVIEWGREKKHRLEFHTELAEPTEEEAGNVGESKQGSSFGARAEGGSIPLLFYSVFSVPPW